MQSLESKDCHKGGPFLLCESCKRYSVYDSDVMKDCVEGSRSEIVLRLSGKMNVEDILNKFEESFDKLPKNNYSFPIKKYTDDYGYLVYEMCQDLSNKGIDNYVNWEYSPTIEIRNGNNILKEGLYKPVLNFKEMLISLELI